MSRALEIPGPGLRALPRPEAPGRAWVWLERLLTVGVGLVILAGVLFYVWQHTQVLRQSYAIERLRAQHAQLVQENKALRLEQGQLRALKRVEEIARTRLGMVTPKPGQVVVVPEGAIQ